MMQVVILGHVCIDHNFSEHARYQAAGGPAVFIHRVTQHLTDVETTVISPYGADFLPFQQKLNLLPAQPTTTHTLVYENRTINKSRSQKAIFSETALPIPLTDDLVTVIQKTNLLFVTPLLANFSPAYLRTSLKQVPSNALKILLPQGYFRTIDHQQVVIPREFKEAEEILALFDFAILSEQDYPNLNELAPAWAKKSVCKIIITRGEKGCTVVNSKDKFDVPVQPVPLEQIVDSVGSGDIFSAAFGYKYAQNQDLLQASRYANEVARKNLFVTSNEVTI